MCCHIQRCYAATMKFCGDNLQVYHKADSGHSLMSADCKCSLKDKFLYSPVLTNLKVTLFWVFSASFRLGCTKSFSAPPLDEAAILVVALGLNPRHAKIRRLGFVGSGIRKNKKAGQKLWKLISIFLIKQTKENEKASTC